MRRRFGKGPKRRSRGVGQMLLSKDKDGLNVMSEKFNPECFKELLASMVILHDIPFTCHLLNMMLLGFC